MANKQLVNSVVLNIEKDNPHINIDLSIPIKMNSEDLKKVKGTKDVDLGMIDFSDKTSNLIREVGEEIRKELLAKIK